MRVNSATKHDKADYCIKLGYKYDAIEMELSDVDKDNCLEKKNCKKAGKSFSNETKKLHCEVVEGRAICCSP